MKTRQGFVSNSSSSSFVCNRHPSSYNTPFDREDVVKKLKIIYQCAVDLGIRMAGAEKFEEVFGDIRKATKEDIDDLNSGWDADLKFHDQMFLINSASDNTIPCEFFALILELFNADRIHLG